MIVAEYPSAVRDRSTEQLDRLGQTSAVQVVDAQFQRNVEGARVVRSEELTGLARVQFKKSDRLGGALDGPVGVGELGAARHDDEVGSPEPGVDVRGVLFEEGDGLAVPLGRPIGPSEMQTAGEDHVVPVAGCLVRVEESAFELRDTLRQS